MNPTDIILQMLQEKYPAVYEALAAGDDSALAQVPELPTMVADATRVAAGAIDPSQNNQGTLSQLAHTYGGGAARDVQRELQDRPEGQDSIEGINFLQSLQRRAADTPLGRAASAIVPDHPAELLADAPGAAAAFPFARRLFSRGDEAVGQAGRLPARTPDPLEEPAYKRRGGRVGEVREARLRNLDDRGSRDHRIPDEGISGDGVGSSLRSPQPEPDDSEEMITLRHYGPGAEADVIDPAKMGTGPHAGAERRRIEGYPESPARSYFYPVDDAFKGPESFFGNQPHVDVQVPAGSILRDPDEIKRLSQDAYESTRTQYGYDGEQAQARFEQAVIDAGYEGVQVDVPGAGRQVLKFTPTPTQTLESRIAKTHADADGSTFNPRTGESLAGEDQWAVATPTQQLYDAAPTEADIAAFRAAHAEELADPNSMIGSWFDKEGGAHGKHELNITRVYPRKQDAVRYAGANEEASIMHLSDFSEYYPNPRERISARRSQYRGAAGQARLDEEILQGLGPEEAEYFNNVADRGTKQKIRDVYLASPTPRSMASMALAGRDMRGWYRAGSANAGALRDAFGEDAPRFTAALAALSPQVPVERNMDLALDAWHRWDSAGRPTDPDEIRQLFPRRTDKSGNPYHLPEGAIPSAENGMIRAFTATDDELMDPAILEGVYPDAAGQPGSLLEGTKVNNFYANLMGNVQRLTLDTHMFSGAGGQNSATIARQLGYGAAVRNGARQVGDLTGQAITPAEAQEMIWSPVRLIRERANGSRSAASIVQNPEEMARIQEEMANTPTFASLLSDPSRAERLQGMGYQVPAERPVQGWDEPAYHGTAAPHNFSPEEMGPWSHVGTPEAANDRLRHTGALADVPGPRLQGEAGARVMPVRVRGNYLDSPDLGHWRPEQVVGEGVVRGSLGPEALQEIITTGATTRGKQRIATSMLEDLGYSGLRYRNKVEGPGSTSHLVFNPERDVISQFDPRADPTRFIRGMDMRDWGQRMEIGRAQKAYEAAKKAGVRAKNPGGWLFGLGGAGWVGQGLLDQRRQDAQAGARPGLW